jgi:hypothetical protein
MKLRATMTMHQIPNVTAGAKSVSVAKTTTGDYRASVFLSCTLSGKKLEPFVITRIKQLKKG